MEDEGEVMEDVGEVMEDVGEVVTGKELVEVSLLGLLNRVHHMIVC